MGVIEIKITIRIIYGVERIIFYQLENLS